MVIISRRDFLKMAMVFTGGLTVNTRKLFAASTKGNENPPLIWLQGSGCTGCSVSTLGVSDPTTIDDVLLNIANMKFHNNIMALAGQQAMDSLDAAATQYNGKFILVIEGAIPTAEDGKYCIVGNQNGIELTMKDAVLKYGPMALYVVAAGTCASFGGVTAAAPNETSSVGVKTLLTNPKNPIINLPGCPVHPTVIIEALVALITGGLPSLDAENRPSAIYQNTIHDNCDLINTPKCFQNKGCKGTDCLNVCSVIKWNGKYCTKDNYPCYGCARSDFPTNPLIPYPDSSTWDGMF